MSSSYSNQHGTKPGFELNDFIRQLFSYATSPGPGGEPPTTEETIGWVRKHWNELKAETKEAIRQFEHRTKDGWAWKIADAILEAVGE